MEENISNLNNKIYSNINNILLKIINDLQKIKNDSKDIIIINGLSDIIIKINNIIIENKKNTELIRIEISKLYNQLKNQTIELKSNQEIKYNNKDSRNRYIG